MLKDTILCIIVIILCHLYVALELFSNISIHVSVIGYTISAISFVLIIIGIFAKNITRMQYLSDALTWVGMLQTGFFSSIMTCTVFRQIILYIYSFFDSVNTGLYLISMFIVFIIAFFATITGFINARRLAKVQYINIPIKNLHSSLDGFTIAQISDIHVGPTIKYKYLKSIVDKVNTLNADVVAITGDLVDGSVKALSDHTSALTYLNSKHGSFFVLGNHEYYSGAVEWTDELTRLGVNVLLNEHMVITHNDANLVIAGITDYCGKHYGLSHKSDPEKAIFGAPNDTIKILLAHQPRSAFEASKYDYSLQLSGHTHGGQFWPWNILVRFKQPFTSGLNKMGGMWVYISRGTGYWGPPKRFGISSEITLITLVRK